jgi:hypothetical protein
MKSPGLAIHDGIAAKIFRFVDGGVPGRPDKHIDQMFVVPPGQIPGMLPRCNNES